MVAFNYLGYFAAGMATLLIGVPQFAADNKLNRSKVPAFVYQMSRPMLLALNVLALIPGIVVLAQNGVFSVPTLLVVLGMIFGAVPVLAYLMAPVQGA